MQIATVIGTLAAVASTTSFAPQAWKIVKSRHTADISSVMYLLTVGGFALWTTYGIVLKAWPLILCNGICLVLASFILVMKLLPKPKKDKVADVLDPET